MVIDRPITPPAPVPNAALLELNETHASELHCHQCDQKGFEPVGFKLLD